jgi:protein-L-isoaspartate(D-aspartate) O-methyltransferase
VEIARTKNEDRFGGARKRLAQKLAASGIRDVRVLDAIASVPRHLLIADALSHQAYDDVAIPIGEGQTISAPGIVAAMTEALELTGKERVLEIGTGSAYQAAILARLAERVISIERIPALATRARTALDRLGVTNVIVYLGDGTRGRPADGPFDAIIVTAGGPEIPAPLLEQLAPGGRLVGPFGPRGAQRLLRVRRALDGRLGREELGACRFVDLIGEHGFRA